MNQLQRKTSSCVSHTVQSLLCWKSFCNICINTFLCPPQQLVNRERTFAIHVPPPRHISHYNSITIWHLHHISYLAPSPECVTWKVLSAYIYKVYVCWQSFSQITVTHFYWHLRSCVQCDWLPASRLSDCFIVCQSITNFSWSL